MMKTLKVYMKNGEYVIEHINSFNHATKSFFISEEGLKEGLKVYSLVMDEYELDVSKELWALVINYVSSKEFLQ